MTEPGAGGAPSPDRCSACGSTELTRLPMVLTDGTDVTFTSCHRCERRAWLTMDGDGAWQGLPIEDVIERSARKPR